MIEFLVNDKVCSVTDVGANTTLLEYLREDLKLKGTKEGCASGDCGACTVTLACLNSETQSLEYLSVNSCMTLVGSLDAKQVITVEYLEDESDLHSCQKAMVEHHGSQCGFCTPGFVMSLFTYYKTHDVAAYETLKETLAGNLCRCTGYRPIISAGLHMLSSGKPDKFERNCDETIVSLDLMRRKTEIPNIVENEKQFFCPRTRDQLAQLLISHPEARLVAGGTDLVLEINQSLQDIKTLISVSAVEEMTTISISDGHLIIGAAATFSQFQSTLIDNFPNLEELISRFGSLQIRNQCTLGGNIANASPVADMPVFLIAMNTKLTLRRGEDRRTILIEDFFKSYKKTALKDSEFIEDIRIPMLKNRGTLKLYKISKRLEDDISSVCTAINLEIKDNFIQESNIVFGAMAEIPKRAKHCEAALNGKAWTEETMYEGMQALEQDFSPISDFRGSSEYRLEVSKNLLLRYFLERDSTPEALIRITQYV